jgi:hypothetical protein
MYGSKIATAIAAFESSQVYALKDLVEKEKIDCDFVLTRAVDAFLDQDHSDKAQAEFETLIKGQEPSTRDVCCKIGNEAVTMSGVKGAKVAFSFTAGHLWSALPCPLRFQPRVANGITGRINWSCTSCSGLSIEV